MVLALAGLWLFFTSLTFAQGPYSQAAFPSSSRFYHLQKSRGRWSFIDPDGHPVFIRAVSQVDTGDFGGQGNFQSYDAAYLQSQGRWSPNLAVAARNSLSGDVVNTQGVTVSAAGDTIFLGSERFVPIATYFSLARIGTGGAMKWYYSNRSGGWSLINGSGNPIGGNGASAALDSGGGYSFDVGGYFQPDSRGFAERRGPNADRILWWPQAGPPADFAPATLPNDRTPRYYLKGVVTQAFTTAPFLNQAYERDQLIERIKAKYGHKHQSSVSGSGVVSNKQDDAFLAWGNGIDSRFREWGFNATGQYSFRYWQVAPHLSEPLPMELTWQLSGHAMRRDFPYQVKNVYAGAVCPPGSRELVYQGHQADVFDPKFSVSLKEQATKLLSQSGRGSYFALIPEEADDLFGLNNAERHYHLGYIVLAQNPYVAKNVQDGIEYSDHKVYSKIALRDFLKTRYNGSIDALNGAWGTHYTTWGTSSGDLASGTNAWASGTGFMDENGQHIYYPQGAPCGAGTRIQYNSSFTNAAFPALRKDLDDFVEYFANTYGEALSQALAQKSHPLVFLPLYKGPAMAYRGLAPYVDGFWVNQGDQVQLKKIYDETGRPIILADYSTANPDSPLFFHGTISSVRYNPSSDLTTLSVPDAEYIFRAPWQISFPDAGLTTGACQLLQGLTPYPRLAAARWDSFDLHGNYAQCIARGAQLELFNWVTEPPSSRSQNERAKAMIARLKTALELKGNDGNAFVVGFEHWALYDDSPSNYSEIGNFGLLALDDNAYDGVEARRAIGKDSRGYDRGGEERDYGNLLGPLSQYLKTIDEAR